MMEHFKERYCRGCGLKMETKQINLRFHSFTGEPRYDTQYKCPLYRWYRFYLHDKYVNDPKHGKY